MAYGYFYSTMAELSSNEQDTTAPNIYELAPYRENLQTPGFRGLTGLLLLLFWEPTVGMWQGWKKADSLGGYCSNLQAIDYSHLHKSGSGRDGEKWMGNKDRVHRISWWIGCRFEKEELRTVSGQSNKKDTVATFKQDGAYYE